MQVFNVYLRNDAGVSYAAQGYHIGDGVTLRNDIVQNHTLITNIINDLKAADKQAKKPKGK